MRRRLRHKRAQCTDQALHHGLSKSSPAVRNARFCDHAIRSYIFPLISGRTIQEGNHPSVHQRVRRSSHHGIHQVTQHGVRHVSASAAQYGEKGRGNHHLALWRLRQHLRAQATDIPPKERVLMYFPFTNITRGFFGRHVVSLFSDGGAMRIMGLFFNIYHGIFRDSM
jgi:hypothetical protein